MRKALLTAVSLALAAPAPFIPASAALAKGPPAGSAECEDMGLILMCVADTRLECQLSVAAVLRDEGRERLVTPRCEELSDGRWIFLLWTD